MTPSVRGRSKALVAAALIAAGTATGALTGFAAGAAWAVVGLPALSPVTLTVLVALAAAADAMRLAAPPSLRSQVPRVWSELLAPWLVALLYGARLGVGPLTILVTWLWWAAALGGAALGPAQATLAGAAFGCTRLLVVVVAAELLRPAMPVRMARLRRAEPAVHLATVALALLAVIAPV